MSRAVRFGAQLALLPILWVLSEVNENLALMFASIAIVTIWPFVLAVAFLLWWLAREGRRRGRPSETLEEASDTATTAALIETGLVFAASVTILRIVFPDTFGTEGSFPIPGRPVLVTLVWGLVILGVPALGWMKTLRDVWLPRIDPRRRE